MKLDIKSVFVSDGASLSVNYQLDLSHLIFSGVDAIKEPVNISGRVFNRAGIVTFSVVCDFTFSAPCDRCGTDTDIKYSLPIERVLVQRLAKESDDEIIEVPDMMLDVDLLCEGEIVLSLPMKHLCSPDCKGICATCGKNLNEGACDCKTDKHDPRLSALASLLENND